MTPQDYPLSSLPHHRPAHITCKNSQWGVQVLLAMVQDRISREEAGELLDQWVHLVNTNQELRHSTINYVQLVGGYLVTYGPLNQAMSTWLCHIDRFE